VESGAVTIPTSAMVFQERGAQVVVLTEGDRVHFKDIAVGKMYDNYIEVKDGVSNGERIVNNPNAALLEGDKVKIVTPAAGYEVLGHGVEDPTPIGSKK
jgi:multidrug efflux pump subunit AcrA (membrane-fusion protein)